MKTKIQYLIIALALLAGVHHTAAQGTTAFTYQGQLKDNGTNANGAYGMVFKLYDALTGGNLVGSPSAIANSVTLANGLFTVNLDFGSVFDGSARWLEITVTNSGNTQTLAPRVQLMPSPYAEYAAVAATVINGAITANKIALNGVANSNIVSVSSSKISGAVASAASFTNGIWSIGAGDFQSPNSGPIFSNTLIFSAQGVPQAVLSSSLPGLYVNGDLNGGTGHLNAVQFNGNGSTVSGTGGGLLLDTAGDLIINSGNFHLTNNNFRLSADGYVEAYNFTASQNIEAHGALVTAEIHTYPGQPTITVNGSLNLGGGSITAGSFYNSSDRNLKEKFSPTDSLEILRKVAQLPITSWNFKADSTRHIGPMAQDFYNTFNVGLDSEHIATVDEGGVALAAIQGLNQKLEEQLNRQDAENAKLRQQNDALFKRLKGLEAALKALAEKK